MTRVRLHTLPIRVWHWTNAFLILVLILTGIQLRIPGLTLFGTYGNSVWLHKYAGFFAAGSSLFWFIYAVGSGALWRHYLPRPSDLKGMAKQAAFYGYHVFRGEENPFKPSPDKKFNPMQKLAYFGMMLFVTPVIVVTGVFFSDILYFLSYIEAIGGLRVLDAIHVAAAYAFLLYLLVHLYMGTLGRTIFAHTKAMIVGYEEEDEEEEREEEGTEGSKVEL
jgi:thiosulfate reductase cytochrome b subunit